MNRLHAGDEGVVVLLGHTEAMVVESRSPDSLVEAVHQPEARRFRC